MYDDVPMYMDLHESIRFRVESLAYVDVGPVKETAANTNEEILRDPPLKIIVIISFIEGFLCRARIRCFELVDGRRRR
jgi:hypothetical protein